MKLLLDSNTINYLLRHRLPATDHFRRALASGAGLVLSIVVDYELRRYLLLKGATALLRRYVDLTRDWSVVGLDPDDWQRAAETWAELHRTGRAIDDRDLLIAESARKAGATLVTSNARHFVDLGVPLVDWMVD